MKENSMVVEVGWMAYYMVVSWADETALLKAALSVIYTAGGTAIWKGKSWVIEVVVSTVL